MRSEQKPIGHRFLARESAFLLALMLVLCQLAIADTLTVKQDGTGHYTQIQQALDAASDNDVILVYPGTYFENLVMPPGNLELSSTYVLSSNRADIYATVVDGNHNGSCVQFTHDGYQYVVNGLVFQNGSGTQLFNSTTTRGGGVYIKNADVEILNCVIQCNRAAGAGGIDISNYSNVILKGNIIKNNRGISSWGGICLRSNSTIVFDTIQLNSVFNNYAPTFREYVQDYLSPPIRIKLDTVTTEKISNHYYFASIDLNAYNTYLVEVEGQTGYYGYIEQDVYVSPQGDDANSGLSPDEPLKSLSMALTRIVSDSLIERSIHLAAGTYSATATGELFPLQFKHNISIKGAGSGQTIIDLEDSGNLSGLFIVGTYRFRMHGVTIQNGALPEFQTTGFADFYVSRLVEFRDVVFSNANMFEKPFGPTFKSIDTAIIDSCRFIGNVGGRGVYFYNSPTYLPVKPEIKLDMYTTVFSENTYDGGTEYQTCPQLALNGHNSTQYIARADVVNCLFDNNSDNLFQLRQGVCINARESFVNIVNSTFANNVTAAVVGAAIYVRSRTHVKAWNSIFYQNQPNQLTLYENSQDWDFPVSLEVSHSMVTDGLSGIANIGTGNTIVYHPSNIDTDPLFTGYGDFPYSLSGLSPCIDAGTLELPEGITLPATDLAGNPRVWGGSVDMGAYEFNPVTIGESRLKAKPPARLVAAPNPFVHELGLTVTPKTGVPVCITVHNLLGREVARLLDQTDNRLAYTTLQWNGRGSAGENLPAGAYIISLVENGKEVESLRVVKSER